MHAAAQTIVPGILGYDVPVSCPKDQGWFYVSFYVPPNENQQGNTTVWVRVASEHNPSVRGQMTIYYSFDRIARQDRTPRIGQQFMTKGNNARETKGEFNVNTTGLYYVSGQCNCQNQCPDELQYGVVTGRIEWVGQYRAFQLRHNPWTSNYTNLVLAGSFGPPGFLDISSPTAVFIQMFAYDPVTEVIMVYSRDMPIERSSVLPTAADSDDLKRFPAAGAAPLSGTYGTGPITLGVGRWYIAPYLVTKALTNKPQEFKFAVGVGQEPDPTISIYGAASQISSFSAFLICAIAAIVSLF
jgi:hypothetical protein